MNNLRFRSTAPTPPLGEHRIAVRGIRLTDTCASTNAGLAPATGTRPAPARRLSENLSSGGAVPDGRGGGGTVGTREVPDLALSLPEAGEALGVSRRPFHDEILTDLQIVGSDGGCLWAFARWHIGSMTVACCPAWRREVMMPGSPSPSTASPSFTRDLRVDGTAATSDRLAGSGPRDDRWLGLDPGSRVGVADEQAVGQAERGAFLELADLIGHGSRWSCLSRGSGLRSPFARARCHVGSRVPLIRPTAAATRRIGADAGVDRRVGHGSRVRR